MLSLVEVAAAAAAVAVAAAVAEAAVVLATVTVRVVAVAPPQLMYEKVYRVGSGCFGCYLPTRLAPQI